MTEKKASIKQVANIIATGRLGGDPKTVGEKYTAASLAVNQSVKVDGEWADGPTMWWQLMDGGSHIEGFSKGDAVTVEGRLAMRASEEYGNQYTIWVEKAYKAVAKVKATVEKPKADNPKPETDLAFPE